MDKNDDKKVEMVLVNTAPYLDVATGRYGVRMLVNGEEAQRTKPDYLTEPDARRAGTLLLELLQEEMAGSPGVSSQRVRVKTEGERQ